MRLSDFGIIHEKGRLGGRGGSPPGPGRGNGRGAPARIGRGPRAAWCTRVIRLRNGLGVSEHRPKPRNAFTKERRGRGVFGHLTV
jgi:hypothetical protein